MKSLIPSSMVLPFILLAMGCSGNNAPEPTGHSPLPDSIGATAESDASDGKAGDDTADHADGGEAEAEHEHADCGMAKKDDLDKPEPETADDHGHGHDH
jgi:hypothetical protein